MEKYLSQRLTKLSGSGPKKKARGHYNPVDWQGSAEYNLFEVKKDNLGAASLGLEIAVLVFLCAGSGYFSDKFFNTSPWLMVAGVITGGIAGIWNAYKYAR